METKKKPWLLVVVLLAAALLSLWGMERVWTAAELLPENQTAAPSVSQKSVDALKREETESADALPELEEETATRYAVGRHKRNKTLSDPFRTRADMPMPMSKEGGAPAQQAASSVPRLCGIVTAGDDRRAILDAGGTTQTCREGEGTAGWTVTEIKETEVYVTGSFGTQVLTL